MATAISASMDVSFFVGLALGAIVASFLAIGSFDRGFDSARRTEWSRELHTRTLAVVRARTSRNDVTSAGDGARTAS
jgi:hypothetical protein